MPAIAGTKRRWQHRNFTPLKKKKRLGRIAENSKRQKPLSFRQQENEKKDQQLKS
jgi:hypothetical protein